MFPSDLPSTPSPPPISDRNSHHHVSLHPLSSPLSPIRETAYTAALIPDPLFTQRKRRHRRHRQPLFIDTIPATILEIPLASPRSSWPSRSLHTPSPSSPPWTFNPSPSSSASSPLHSPTPSTIPHPLGTPPSSSSYLYSPGGPPWIFPPSPVIHVLRRKPSPQGETLRALREKESEACLARCYERQTCAYLEGSLSFRAPQGRRKGAGMGVGMGD